MTTENNSAGASPANAMEKVSRDAGALVDWEQMAMNISRTVKFQDQVRQLIDKAVNPETCFDKLDGVLCRNINYARTAFPLLGGKMEWMRDVNGQPLVIRQDYTDKNGAYYVYEAYVRYTLPNGHVVETSGAFSSRDKFFAREGVYENGQKTGTRLKGSEEVDERAVRQAAQTEAFKKAVFTALGLTTLDEGNADFARNVGDGYKHQSRKPDQKPQEGGQLTPEEQRVNIASMVDEMFEGGFRCGALPPGSPSDVLEHITQSGQFKGWRNPGKITERSLPITTKQVREAYDGWKKQQPAETGGTGEQKQ